MAGNASGEHGKTLVIVESPTKAGTIRKALGPAFIVEASVGHVRDLVTKKSDLLPKDKRRKEPWVKYGVNIDNGFDPLEEIYRVPPGKKRQIEDLKEAIKHADALFLATDDDREGEAISWHLVEELKPKVPVQRLVFREITPRAIKKALESPRQIDMDLVTAQRTRRIIDRLFGWDVSQLLWRKIRPGLSAGRVQSVALRMLTERERQRMAFVRSEYWDLRAKFVTGGESATFQADLVKVAGKPVASSKDFDKLTGKLSSTGVLVLDGAAAEALVARVKGVPPKVAEKNVKPIIQRPQAPFTTSTMQQAAHGKLRFSAQRTMRVAQSLYEKGAITYMRTDSNRLSDEATSLARERIASLFGKEFVPEEVRTFKNKSKNMQDAHEAIRPAGHQFDSVDELSVVLSEDEKKLYKLIWQRAIGSQMADAQLEQTTFRIAVDDAIFRVGGRVVKFPGFLLAAGVSDNENMLPTMNEGDTLTWGDEESLVSLQHFSQPPSRLNDASLVKALEERGIGRPSTYASIIQSIIERNYVFRRSSTLIPTFMGMAVVKLLESHMPHLVDFDFTAHMEARLDEIAQGEADYATYLQRFYREGFPDVGEARNIQGLTQMLAEVSDKIDPATASSLTLGTVGEDPVLVKIGRYGTFLKHGEDTASLSEDVAPDELSLEIAMELIAAKKKGDEPIGQNANGDDVFVRKGRFGIYFQAGEKDTDEYRTASLSRGMKADEVDLTLALRQLSLPRELGVNPDNKEPVFAHVGRYGDYVKSGKETRNLDDIYAIDVDFDQALALLRMPKLRGKTMLRAIGVRESDGAEIELWRGRYGPYVTDGTYNKTLGDIDSSTVDVASATVLLVEAKLAKDGKLLGQNDKEADVRVLKGRFGPYLTDGAMNASLPRGMEFDSVDLIFALERLAQYGKPVKKKKKPASRKKKAPAKKKKAPAKKTARKKA